MFDNGKGDNVNHRIYKCMSQRCLILYENWYPNRDDNGWNQSKASLACADMKDLWEYHEILD